MITVGSLAYFWNTNRFYVVISIEPDARRDGYMKLKAFGSDGHLYRDWTLGVDVIHNSSLAKFVVIPP